MRDFGVTTTIPDEDFPFWTVFISLVVMLVVGACGGFLVALCWLL